MADETPAHKYKIILLGDPGVGKTSCFKRLKDNDFGPKEELTTEPTIPGQECTQYTFNIDGTKVQANVYDTAGQERYRTLTTNYYRDSDAAIIMFQAECPEPTPTTAPTQSAQPTSSPSTCDREWVTSGDLGRWINELDHYVTHTDNYFYAVALNKCDLVKKIDHKGIRETCKQSTTDFLIFTSAKTGDNVKEMFEEVTRGIHKKRVGKSKENDPMIVRLIGQKRSTDSKKGCCS